MYHFFKIKMKVFNEYDFLLLYVYACSSVLKQLLDACFPSFSILVYCSQRFMYIMVTNMKE